MRRRLVLVRTVFSLLTGPARSARHRPRTAVAPVGTGTRAGGVVVLRADPAQAVADVGRSWTFVLLGACATALVFVAPALAR